MKNSWNIFSTDLRKTGTNWVALIIIGGLIILPSLYAWLNITAAWDPYGQLDQMPIGIVNEDRGAMLRDEEIFVGNELIESLKDNDSMDWHFTNRDTAMESVEYGDFFAVIIIPEDFSEKLATVTSDSPEKANVEYYVNEKINAISPKMTDKGAGVIVENVSSQFISTVNGVIFDLFNSIGFELESDLPDIERFENYIFEMEERLPEIHQILNESLTDATNATDIIDNAQRLIPQAENMTADGLQTIEDTLAFLNDAENRLNEMAPKIQERLEHIQEITANVDNFIQDIQTADLDFTNGEQLSSQVESQIAEAIKQIELVETALLQLQEQAGNESNENTQDQEQSQDSSDEENLNEEQSQGTSNENTPNQEQINVGLEQLAVLKAELTEIQSKSKELITFIDETNEDVNQVLVGLQERAATTSESIDTFIKEYKETIEPTVLENVDKAKETLTQAQGVLLDIQDTIPEVENILSRTDSNLGEGKDLLEEILGEYPYVNSKITTLAERIRLIQGETDIGEIIELLQNDPEAEKNFFAEPVLLDEYKIFPIANYGAGMTPFYTVLAIWVGGLLLISLLSTEVYHPEGFTMKQQYVGKLLTYLFIGILQTLIVTSGDILLLKVEIAHPGWLILFGLFISIVFMTITYTLVSVFGDIGKAMVIVLLVLQIAGSGGTYPVVLLPDFFQMINPFLPFTYAIDLLREAVGGIVWDRVLYDTIRLFLFGLAAFILGLFLKQPINKHTQKLIQKSRESGIFH